MNFKDLANKTLITDSELDWQELGAGVKRKVMPFDET